MAQYKITLDSGISGIFEAENENQAKAKAEAAIVEAGQKEFVDKSNWPKVIKVEKING